MPAAQAGQSNQSRLSYGTEAARSLVLSGGYAGLHCPVLRVVVHLAAIGLAQLGCIMADWCDATLWHMGAGASALACLGIHA